MLFFFFCLQIFFHTYRKRQNTKAKFNNLRDRIQWFKDQLTVDQTQLSKQEIHQLIERFFHDFSSFIRLH